MANMTMNYGSGIKGIVIANCHKIVLGLRLKDSRLSNHYRIIAHTCFALIILTVILNLVTLIVFYSRRKRIRTHEIILAGLACADLFNGIISLPSYGILFLNLARKNANCVLILTTICSSMCGMLLTISTLTLASLDRYFAIFRPYFYDSQSQNPFIALKALLITWILSLTICITSVMTPSFRSYIITFVVLIVAIIPFNIILHTKAYLIARHVDNRVHCQTESQNNFRRRSNAKAVRIIGVIIAAMCICYFPHLFATLYRHKYHYDIASLVMTWTTVLGLLNSTINPIIYCFQMDSFRKDLCLLLSRSKERVRSQRWTLSFQTSLELPTRSQCQTSSQENE